MRFILAYADNTALGFFKRHGFTARIAKQLTRWMVSAALTSPCGPHAAGVECITHPLVFPSGPHRSLPKRDADGVPRGARRWGCNLISTLARELFCLVYAELEPDTGPPARATSSAIAKDDQTAARLHEMAARGGEDAGPLLLAALRSLPGPLVEHPDFLVGLSQVRAFGWRRR